MPSSPQMPDSGEALPVDEMTATEAATSGAGRLPPLISAGAGGFRQHPQSGRAEELHGQAWRHPLGHRLDVPP